MHKQKLVSLCTIPSVGVKGDFQNILYELRVVNPVYSRNLAVTRFPSRTPPLKLISARLSE